MQSQLLTLEEEKKALDAKLAQEHRQLESAITQHKAMSDQIQQVTNSLEQKCRDEMAKADQKMAHLQVRGRLLKHHLAAHTFTTPCYANCAFPASYHAAHTVHCTLLTGNTTGVVIDYAPDMCAVPQGSAVSLTALLSSAVLPHPRLSVQGEHTTETAALCAKQQLELQSALDAAVKQQEAVASVEMRMSQLKIDHEQLMTQHTQEKEASLKQAEKAKNAAVEVCQPRLPCQQV